jgi:hypothetical protein
MMMKGGLEKIFLKFLHSTKWVYDFLPAKNLCTYQDIFHSFKHHIGVGQQQKIWAKSFKPLRTFFWLLAVLFLVRSKQASFGKGRPLLSTSLLSFDIFGNWKMIKQNNHDIKSILSSTSSQS